MFKNTALAILMLIMVVNALAYGMIIPLFYPYATQFGIGPVGMGVLFASFSLAQFIATPILGRLSDYYGRKPVLLGCFLGTALSLALFGAATNVAMLFIARILDGITGGNMSVAQAMVADSTTGNERAKNFGMLGAAFGFGFLLGPALGGVLSHWGLSAPFYFAAVLAGVGTVLGQAFLHETLHPEQQAENRTQTHKPLFHWQALYHALFSPTIGLVLLLTFLSGFAHNAFVIGFQSYTSDILKLSAFQIGLIFTLLGVVNVGMQAGGLRSLLKLVPSKKKLLLISLYGCTAALVFLFFSQGPLWFMTGLILYMIVFAVQPAMTSGLLSERTKAEDQGAVLGINQSYMSLGQIVGPLVAGWATGIWSVQAVFLLAGGVFLVGAVASRGLFVQKIEQVDI